MSDKTLDAALQRLTKWRSVFAGWQLGTRSMEDPECQAVRDHREVTILMRAELNAMLSLLVEKGEEANRLSGLYEEKFPGMKATDFGIQYDTKRAAETMKGWKP